MKEARYVSVLWCLIPGLIIASPTHRQKKPDIDQILPALMQKVEQDFLYLANNYTHEEVVVTERYKNNVVSKIEEMRYLVKHKDGFSQKKLLSKDRLPVSDTTFGPKKDLITINKRFFERYNFSLIGSETLGKEKCWILAFSPKNKWPEERMEDRVLNNLAGEARIRQSDLSFVRLWAQLVKEVDFAWPGFLLGGRVKNITANVETHFVEGRFAILVVRVEYWYSKRVIFNFDVHGLTAIYYENYKRKEEEQ